MRACAFFVFKLGIGHVEYGQLVYSPLYILSGAYHIHYYQNTATPLMTYLASQQHLRAIKACLSVMFDLM